MADPKTIENDLRYLAKCLGESTRSETYPDLRYTVDQVLTYGQMIQGELKNEDAKPMRHARSVVETVIAELHEGLERSGKVGTALASLPPDSQELKNELLPRVEGILREHVNAAAQNVPRLLEAAERLRNGENISSDLTLTHQRILEQLRKWGKLATLDDIESWNHSRTTASEARRALLEHGLAVKGANGRGIRAV